MTEPCSTATPAVPVWRIVLITVATVVGVPVGVVVSWVAAILWTGCFLSCERPDRLAGGLLGVLAGTLLLAGPLLAGALTRRWSAVRAAALGALALLALLGILTLAG